MSRKLKDSGIPWIGQVPAKWEIKRFRYIASEILKGNGIKKDEVVENGDTPCVRYGEIYTKYNQSFRECSSRTNVSLVPLQRFASTGDILFAGTGESVEEIGKNIAYLGDEKILVGGDIVLARHDQNAGFLSYALNSAYSQRQKSSGKSKLKVVHISSDDIKNIVLLVPPLSEQKAIAEFLDGKCAEIDGLREKIEKQIATLEEYKKSLITESVTRGLDPNAPMKDSGVPWIGQVPEGWKVERLPFQFSFSKGLNITKADLVEEGIAVISYGQIHAKHNNGVHLQPSLLRFVPESVADADGSARLKFGDIVFADTSEDLDGAGNCVLVDTREEVFAGYHTLVARPNQADFARYFAYLFQSPNWRSQLRSTVNGIKVFSITQRVLRGTTIIVPPLSEQKAIAEFLDGKCAEIDAETEKCRGMLERLEEYKKALIFECVTGKKEVV